MMQMFQFAAITGLVISLACMGWCGFMLCRNTWVYEQRIDLLHEDYMRYRTLPSYEYMLKRWWVWDIEAFLPGGKHHQEAA